jgi:(p)ppGpp synthase/HD superfamily hydrolase
VLTDAILFAADKHRHQTRKNSSLPYVVHPLEVMHILIRHGVRDEATLAAAVLHDVVEDCGVSATEVEQRFGRPVAELVAALTKPPKKKGTDEKQAKAQALEQVRRGPEAARIVKMADRLSNLRDLDALDWHPSWKADYRDEAEAIARLGQDALPSLADELLHMVAAQRAGRQPAE